MRIYCREKVTTATNSFEIVASYLSSLLEYLSSLLSLSPQQKLYARLQVHCRTFFCSQFIFATFYSRVVSLLRVHCRMALKKRKWLTRNWWNVLFFFKHCFLKNFILHASPLFVDQVTRTFVHQCCHLHVLLADPAHKKIMSFCTTLENMIFSWSLELLLKNSLSGKSLFPFAAVKFFNYLDNVLI